MIKLQHALDQTELEMMLASGYVRQQQHPELPYRIFNYTERAQFDRVWNNTTLACRGLVVDSSDHIVARPFCKFFNHGEQDWPDVAGLVHVTDKLDGSLGILYPVGNGEHAVATRGSFTSDQAVHATRVWKERYAHVFCPRSEWTYLFEIVYPSNRIVVDYGNLDDLVLLGAVDILTGRTVRFEDACDGWPGPVVEVLPYVSLHEALAAPPRPGKEGCVVHFVDADRRVKLKQEEYVRLHRIVTGVSERRVWEALAAGDDISMWLEGVPDEFYAFVTTTRDRLLADHRRLVAEVYKRAEHVTAELGEGFARREYAAAVQALSKEFTLAPCLFAVLDGKDFSAAVWKALRPTEHVPWSGVED